MSYIDTGPGTVRGDRSFYGRVPGAWPLVEVPEEQPVETTPTGRISASSANVVRNINHDKGDQEWDARSDSDSYIDLGEPHSQPSEGSPRSKSRKSKENRHTLRDILKRSGEEQWDLQSNSGSYIDPGEWHVDQANAGSDLEERTQPRSSPKGRPLGIDGGWDTQSSVRSYIDPGEPHVLPITTRSSTKSVKKAKPGEQPFPKVRQGADSTWDALSSIHSYIDPGLDRSSAGKVKQWLQSSASATGSLKRLPIPVVSIPRGIAVPHPSSRKAVVQTIPITASVGPEIQRNRPVNASGDSEIVDQSASHPHGERSQITGAANAASPATFVIHSKDGDTAIIDADVDFAFPPRRSNSMGTSPITVVLPNHRKREPRAVFVTLPNIDPTLELLPQPIAVAKPWIMQRAYDNPISYQPRKRSEAEPTNPWREASGTALAPHIAFPPPPDFSFLQGQQIEEYRNPTVVALPLSSVHSAQMSPNHSTLLSGSISNFFEYGPLAPTETPVPINDATAQDAFGPTLSTTSAGNSENGSPKDSAKISSNHTVNGSVKPPVQCSSEPVPNAGELDLLSESKKDEPPSGILPAPIEVGRMFAPPVPTDNPPMDSDGFPMPAQQACLPAYTYNTPQDYAQEHPQHLQGFQPSAPSVPMAYSNYQPPAVESVSSSPGKGQPAVPPTGEFTVLPTSQPEPEPVLHRSRSGPIDDGYCNQIWNGIPVRVGPVRMTQYPSKPAQNGEFWD